MPTHNWSTAKDWEYCTLTNCKIVADTIQLSSTDSAEILSDIKDSTTRFYSYGEVIPKLSVVLGQGEALLYLRSGWTSEYYKDAWTDWELVNEPIQRMEYTLSLAKNKIILDYDIGSIANIYCINNSQYQSLALNYDTIYLTPLTDEDADNQTYSYLWSSAVDEAIVDFARVDQEGEPLTIYAQDAVFSGNVITLKNPLPDDNVIVIVKYVPRYYIYTETNRYFQFKVELLSTESIFFTDADSSDFTTIYGENINVGNVEPVSYLTTKEGYTFITSDFLNVEPVSYLTTKEGYTFITSDFLNIETEDSLYPKTLDNYNMKIVYDEGVYVDVSSTNPSLISLSINYRLDYQNNLSNAFPKFIRRL